MTKLKNTLHLLFKKAGLEEDYADTLKENGFISEIKGYADTFLTTHFIIDFASDELDLEYNNFRYVFDNIEDRKTKINIRVGQATVPSGFIVAGVFHEVINGHIPTIEKVHGSKDNFIAIFSSYRGDYTTKRSYEEYPWSINSFPPNFKPNKDGNDVCIVLHCGKEFLEVTYPVFEDFMEFLFRSSLAGAELFITFNDCYYNSKRINKNELDRFIVVEEKDKNYVNNLFKNYLLNF